MRSKAAKKAPRPRKPAKRVSAVKKKRSGASVRFVLRRTWWILRGAAAGTLVLGLLYGAYLGFEKAARLESLSVKFVEVEGCRDVTPQSIERLAGVGKGDPLLKIDLKEVRRKVVSHPSVSDATVVRELPDTLRISVKERVPAAVVLGRRFVLVDGEGVAMAVLDSYPEGYPVITGVSDPVEPGWVVAGAKPALEILQSISRSGLLGPEKISELGVEGKLVRVSLMGSGTVLVMEQGATAGQVERLARLMESGFFDNRLPGYDLRFEGRVIGMPERKFDTPGESGISHAGG